MPGAAEKVIDGLRLDVERWKSEMADLKASGQAELVERVKSWIAEAEKVLAKWDEPRES
ncbi:MAG TPA: hypothetical protein VMU31_04060 [Rhizomicrobium sp.]|nr:hypothetical protein [Rhizomicrobium sp.]